MVERHGEDEDGKDEKDDVQTGRCEGACVSKEAGD